MKDEPGESGFFRHVQLIKNIPRTVIMNIFFWRKNPVVDGYAVSLANKLYETVLPSEVNIFYEGKCDKKQAKSIEKKLDKIMFMTIKGVQEFKVLHSLGVYGKARLHMKFRARLIELGYSSEASVKINEVIMLKTP